MSKSKKLSFSSVTSVDPYKETYLTGAANFLNEPASPKFSKNQFVISHLNTQDYINSQITISKNIPDEDLYDAISNKVYDELALDQAVTYQIQYIETFNNLDEINRHFHVFVVDPRTLEFTFSNVVNKIKYIDLIIPTPLLLKSLYSQDIIDSNAAHCFIYFQKDEALVSIYNNQEFVYAKSIKYSFVQMHERFCELYGERIDYKEFIDFLSTHNLKSSDSDYKDYFIKLYKEIFSTVNDLLTYVKRAFEIENIEHVYIGSQVQTVTKLDEISEFELNIKSSNLEFTYGYESEGLYVDQIHYLMHVYTKLNYNEKYICNFTTFSRPKRFSQRESGKLFMYSVASLLIAFAYPIIYWSLTYDQIARENIAKLEYQQIHKMKVAKEAIVKDIEAQKKKLYSQIKEEREDYIDKKNTLLKIRDVKVDYPMKAKLLVMLTKDLKEFGVNMKSLSYVQTDNSKDFNFSLTSSKDKNITNFLKHLTKKYRLKFNFSLEEITYDVKDRKYFSELKVTIL